MLTIFLHCWQVTFDPSSIYRRKSSLVPSDTPRPRREPDKAQCIVHQFLESQRRASTAREKSERERERDHNHHYQAPNPASKPNTTNETTSNSRDDRLVEPKGKCAILSRGTGSGHASDASSDIGQTDEHHWARQIAKSGSEVDLVHAVGTDGGSAAAGGAAAVDQHELLHSRLLTKKQLSDMAWGVRELSRRLGSMRLKFRVRNIFILTKLYDRDLVPKTRELVRWLLDKERDVRYTVYLEKDLKESKQFDAHGLMEELRKDYVAAGELEEDNSKEISRRLRWWDEHMCRTRPHTFDFAITLGGDGTVLYASWLFQRIVPPVLSFALGSLGFLTKFDYEDFRNTLTGAFKDGVTVSLRLRFEGTIMRSQKKKRKQAMITDGQQNGSHQANGSCDVEGEDLPQSERDLVEELIGEEKEDEHTHKPDGTYEILNEIVVDRGPNPSECFPCQKTSNLKLLSQRLTMIPHISNVLYRNLWRRRTLHFGPSRRHLRVHAHRLDSLQPRCRRLALPPREPRDARDGHLRAHTLLPPHYPARHHRAARRRAVQRAHQLVGLV